MSVQGLDLTAENASTTMHFLEPYSICVMMSSNEKVM
jgi:hypothetical protein